MTEELLELVTRARRRDADAFAALIGRYERTALAVAYAQLHDSHGAGDAVQEAFLRAWQELPRLQDVARFSGWLLQIVRNAAIDMRRRIRPGLKSGSAEFENVPARDRDPARTLEQADKTEQIRSALASLDEVTRTAVVMKYYEGLSAKEIGTLLEMSPAAVDMRLSRARGQLRPLLAEFLDESKEPAMVSRKVAGERI